MSQNENEDVNLEEVQKFMSFKNSNNFDDYFVKVLPSLSK